MKQPAVKELLFSKFEEMFDGKIKMKRTELLRILETDKQIVRRF